MSNLIPIGPHVKLRQGLAINRGSAHLVSDKKDEEFCVPLLRIADMMDGTFSTYISKYAPSNVFAKKGDIVYTRTGQIGLVFNQYEGCVHNNSFVVELQDDVFDKDYLIVALKSSFVRDQALNKAMSSVQPDLTHDMFKDILIPFFKKDIQKKIAKQYNSIDEKIKNNSKIITELESMAKTLYDYWFLQFEFPNENGKPYKSSGGKMVYNKELKREIPESWKVENMMESSLCSDIKAGVEKFESKNYLPTANIEGESITDGEYVTFDNRENRANMQPVKYSVWFAKMKNSIKHLSIPENSEWFINKYILSTGFQGLKCTKTSFAYIHSIINSSWFETYKDILSHGATQEGVNNEDLKNIKYVVPSYNVLIEFNKICMPALEKKFSIIRENQELVSLRDFLLPMLMNGQVTFK